MVSLWRPSTYGEQLFLMLHAFTGQSLKLTHDGDREMAFLADRAGFESFSRLIATFEVFERVLSFSKATYRTAPELPPDRFVSELRYEIDLPSAITRQKVFGEVLKQAGKVVAQKKREYTREISAQLTADEPPYCYLCGVPFDETIKFARRTTEHLWPLVYGGQTELQNLVAACADCNEERASIAMWATGPVHSTHFTPTKDVKTPPKPVRFALALARIYATANNNGQGRQMTLKEAVQRVRPAIPDLDLSVGRSHVFFEMIHHAGVTL
jgi:hypothetical protein